MRFVRSQQDAVHHQAVPMAATTTRQARHGRARWVRPPAGPSQRPEVDADSAANWEWR